MSLSDTSPPGLGVLPRTEITSYSYLCPQCQSKCWAQWKGTCRCLLTKRLECVLGFGHQLIIILAAHSGWTGKTRGVKDANVYTAPMMCLAMCHMHSHRASHSTCPTTPEECITTHSIRQLRGAWGSERGMDSPPKPCPFCSLPRRLPVSCPQSCAPRPAPGTRGRRWSAAHAPGCAGKYPPGGLGGCLHHCQPLGGGNTQEYIVYMWGVGGRDSPQHPTPKRAP